MAFDAVTPRLSDEDRKIADDARAKTLERIRANQGFVVPEHLKGKLFSPMDCFEATLAESHKGLVLRKWGSV